MGARGGTDCGLCLNENGQGKTSFSLSWWCRSLQSPRPLPPPLPPRAEVHSHTQGRIPMKAQGAAASPRKLCSPSNNLEGGQKSQRGGRVCPDFSGCLPEQSREGGACENGYVTHDPGLQQLQVKLRKTHPMCLPCDGCVRSGSLRVASVHEGKEAVFLLHSLFTPVPFQSFRAGWGTSGPRVI